MSDVDVSRLSGFYAPFPRPLRVDVSPPEVFSGEALVNVCINAEFLPYIQTALKALARPESYIGPEECVQQWCQAGMELVLAAWTPCDVGPQSVDFSFFPQDGSWIYQSQAWCVGDSYKRDHYLTSSMTLVGKLPNANYDLAGGEVTDLRIFGIDDQNLIAVTLTYCDNSTETLTGTGYLDIVGRDQDPPKDLRSIEINVYSEAFVTIDYAVIPACVET